MLVCYMCSESEVEWEKNQTHRRDDKVISNK